MNNNVRLLVVVTYIMGLGPSGGKMPWVWFSTGFMLVTLGDAVTQ